MKLTSLFRRYTCGYYRCDFFSSSKPPCIAAASSHPENMFHIRHCDERRENTSSRYNTLDDAYYYDFFFSPVGSMTRPCKLICTKSIIDRSVHWHCYLINKADLHYYNIIIIMCSATVVFFLLIFAVSLSVRPCRPLVVSVPSKIWRHRCVVEL